MVEAVAGARGEACCREQEWNFYRGALAVLQVVDRTAGRTAVAAGTAAAEGSLVRPAWAVPVAVAIDSGSAGAAVVRENRYAVLLASLRS